ncbi:MAG: SpoIIE family protein phosphatase [Candidatus Omnitrophota bacterium]
MKISIAVFKSFRMKITFYMILAMVVAGVISNFMIYRYALNSQFGQLRGKLMTIAQTAALTVNLDDILAIPLDGKGAENPQYKAVCKKLDDIRKVVPAIRFLYILKRTGKPGMLQFMADADAASPDKSQASYPGEEYDALKFPEMLNAFNGPAADRDLGKDKWGVFLSGYAPIRDGSGKAVAILGVDMKAQDVYDVQEGVRNRVLFVLAFGILLAVLLGVFTSGGVTAQVEELTKGASRIATGDLDYQVKIKGIDEIARLGHLFNRMSVDLKRHIEELKRTTAEKERLVKEIEIAKEIQQSFLPDSSPVIAGLDVAAISLPARVVGGDFYDFIHLAGDKWGLVIADVSGKGVPAALFMALSRTLVRSTAQGAVSPSDAINRANDLILQDSKANMFVTLFYAVFDSLTGTFEYANAGHNPPFLLGAPGSDVVLLKAQGVPLGILSDMKSVTDGITLKKDDVIMLYTDGVTEAVNESGEQFEMERLERLVMENRRSSSRSIVDKVREELDLFTGNRPQFDDITIMVLKAI